MDETKDPATALALRSDSIGPVLPIATPEGMAAAMRAYADLKGAVLTENDEQEITVKGKKRKFVKRSGWRRLSIAFGVSTTILDRKITVGPEGRALSAEFTVRATAPNGRFADGWGACSAWEERFQDERGRGKMEHDIPATAETRAENRACSNLFGYGEVSAEEMEDSPGVAKPLCPKCGKPVRQSTFNENEWYCWAKQGGCGWKGSPVMTDSGEIEGSTESKAALQAAQGSDQRQSGAQDSPPATAIQDSAVAVTPAPPVASPAPKTGPRAKRGNVVQAPQGAPKASGDAPAVAGTSAAAPSPQPPAAPEPAPVALDEGEEVYRAELRHQARAGAAVLRLLRVQMKNTEAALNGRPALPEPPATPNKDSDESLGLFITSKHPGKTLDTLGEAELEAVTNQIDALIAKVQAQVK